MGGVGGGEVADEVANSMTSALSEVFITYRDCMYCRNTAYSAGTTLTSTRLTLGTSKLDISTTACRVSGQLKATSFSHATHLHNTLHQLNTNQLEHENISIARKDTTSASE
jgi:hypothetical protein